MKCSNIPSAQSVVYHCKAKGIKNIVISPGSRNAPLTISFSEDSFFKCYSIVDERCAAFFALGIAQQLKEPVVVVCTSGSALLNYYPAIAEAFYSDIPLVVISADRPSYKIDIGDGQTIRQENVFANHIGYSANLKLDVSREIDAASPNQLEIQSYNDAELHTALKITKKEQLPVHINVPFEEPLYTILEKSTVTPFVVSDEEEGNENQLDLNEFTTIWNTAKRKMILVGVNAPNTVEQQFLDELAEDDSVLVFTETTSNLHHPNFFPSIDSIIAPIEKSEKYETLFKELQPDVLLTFGGLIVSKKIKAFLRTYKPKHHWHVDSKKANDTFFCLSHHFKTDANSFFSTFLNNIKVVESDYYRKWALVKENYETKRREYIEEIPFSDMLAFSHVLKSVPQKNQLQLANSSSVRYAQLFNLDASVNVYCNRGTSGIDGSTSTAIGAAIFHKEPTIFITGDLSFLYDSNALWNNYIRKDFRIILFNNSGGGIFRILPGCDKTNNFETYFETTHNLEVSHLCKMHNMQYLKASDEESLVTVLNSFYDNSEEPKLLEIKTPRLLNNKILLSYFDFISYG